VPLYKLARKGIEVPREPRLVHIYNFRFSAYQEPLGHFRIACTKGTYVRSIAHEMDRRPAAALTWRRFAEWRRASSRWRKPSRWRKCSSSLARAGEAGAAVLAIGRWAGEFYR